MYKEKILNVLRTSHTGYVSGEELAGKCGISRTMVWKHIKALQHEGFGIEAVPSRGYRIITIPDILRLDDIRSGLRTRLIGRDIRLYSRIESTNTHAMKIAAEGAAEGTAVIAETQTGGKGRLGRTWISPKGNLLFSIILRPEIPMHKAPLITLTGAVAAASAIRKACQLQAGIKWPNDILLSGKKAGGLLTEMSAEPDRVKHVVLGIGVDVNMSLDELPADVRTHVTTLAAEQGAPINRTELLQAMLVELEHWYSIFLHEPAKVLDAWMSLNVTLGSRIAVSGAGEKYEGLARAIDEDGRLILQLDDGSMRRISAGDVTILKQ